MTDIRKVITRELPLQHNPGTMQFRCNCGKVITFAQNSQAYPMLVDRTFPGPGITIGTCPLCGAKHWRGKTRRN